MKSLFKIIQQTSWQIIGKLVTSLSTFIILAIVARNYGEFGTGEFSLALTYLAAFYLIADFGFNAHVLKRFKSPSEVRASKLKLEWQRLLGTRIIWSLILAFLAVGMLPFWPFTTTVFAQAVSFGSLAIIASGIFVTCNLIFQDKLRYDFSVLSSSLGALSALLLFSYLALLKYPIPLLLIAHSFGWLIIATTSLILVKKVIHTIFPIYDKDYVLNLFKKSWPIAATLTLNVVYFRADSFMISYFKSNAEVGIYNIAYQVFQSALVLPTFIMNAYYPLMLKSLKGIRLVGVGLFFLAAGGTLFTIILAPLITTILTGGGFAGSTQSLQILSLGFPAYFLSSLLIWLMVIKGQYRQMLLIYTLGLVINLSLNFVFIPQFSFYAASWVTVISEYIILIMQIFVLRGILSA